MRHVLFAFVFVSAATTRLAGAQVIVEPIGAVVSGLSPGITIRGLVPAELVRIHALAAYMRGPQQEVMHAWVDAHADPRGIITLDSARPVAGTYTSIDGRALLWSMCQWDVCGSPRRAQDAHAHSVARQ